MDGWIALSFQDPDYKKLKGHDHFLLTSRIQLVMVKSANSLVQLPNFEKEPKNERTSFSLQTKQNCRSSPKTKSPKNKTNVNKKRSRSL
jgi:hypothetical protein